MIEVVERVTEVGYLQPLSPDDFVSKLFCRGAFNRLIQGQTDGLYLQSLVMCFLPEEGTLTGDEQSR